MDVSLMIKHRLDDLGLEQRDLARAAEVTESYISQLLSRKRAPPAPNRTDIYEKMDKVLKLPKGELAKLAAHQRMEHVKRALGDEPTPLFGDVRDLLLRKCNPARSAAVRAAFEKHPFGELARLVTRTILDFVKGMITERLSDEHWLRTVAKLSRRRYQEIRVVALEFLDTDHADMVTPSAVVFLEPLIRSWDIDLLTFELDVELNPKVSSGTVRRFQFAERPPADQVTKEPGFTAFVDDKKLSGTATDDEIAFLASIRFKNARPTPLYYYRELQSLRDPLHFEGAAREGTRAGGDAGEGARENARREETVTTSARPRRPRRRS